MNLYEFIYSIVVHISLMTFIYILVIVFIVYFIYSSIIEYWFTKNGQISYEVFMNHFIQKVSKGNYFMNYGIWNDSSDNLIKANKTLVEYIYEKSGLSEKKDTKILDIGCGYGEQDFLWMNSLDKGSKITAIDISEDQVRIARDKCKRSEFASRLSFDVCDAMLLKTKFNEREFDTIFSVESAFHYSNRPHFFQQVYDILKDDGSFVISDIVLQDSYIPGILNWMFLRLYSDFLHVPKANHISSSEWEKTIKDSGLTIIESIDITEKTFAPYYKHFFKTYTESNLIPSFIPSICYKFFEYVQPFSYKVAVCKKVGTSKTTKPLP